MKSRLSHTPIQQSEPAFIGKAKAYVERHLTESLTLERVARHVYMSPCHLCKTFRRTTGYTFVQYVNARRLARAKELLACTEHSMEHIAAECGFRTASYFSTFFRSKVGVPPMQYRRQYWEQKTDLLE